MAEPLLIAKNDNAELNILPQMANRHGLVTGATGTGKTVTLQALAEGLSKIGVPVFLSDVKGTAAGAGLECGPTCPGAITRRRVLRRHFRDRRDRDWAAPRQCLIKQGLGPFEGAFQVNASPCYPALVRPISRYTSPQALLDGTE